MKAPVRKPLLLLLLASLAAAGHSQAQEGGDVRHSFLVQLVDKPAASYAGHLPGLAATKPAQGKRLNVEAAEVQSYIGYLNNKKASVLSTLQSATVTHQYNVVFNGFAAMLTDAEVRALKKNSAVAKISANSPMTADTSYTPSYLGMTQPGGLWEQAGGQGAAGEDVVIGLLDTGVWPENTGFADRVDEHGTPVFSGGTLAYGPPPASWKGACEEGEGFSAASCNNKLIGARAFRDPGIIPHWTEFDSARDSVAGADGAGLGGHGTHTSTIAAGNGGVGARLGALASNISGMAPRARLAMYKVCWTDVSGANGCMPSDTVAAVEQAIKDGVNVINFSIGSSAGGGAFDDLTEQVFLAASNAGIFVAAAAGNQGPSTGDSKAPVGHISPWLTTVANSTHNRTYGATVTLGNGAKYDGRSLIAATANAPLILARNAGRSGVDPAEVALAQCFGPADKDAGGAPDLLDPAKVAGKVLVCDRGDNPLVNKSANAKAAGAAGLIIVNVDGGLSAVPDVVHSLSTVHLGLAEGKLLKAYMAADRAASASLGGLRQLFDTAQPLPVVADSSSRGPNTADANILKPDVAAPGTSILAGFGVDMDRATHDAIASGKPTTEQAWTFLTGTSMASPHVAGVAAVLKRLHPGWSPAAIKSALMTTASDTASDGLSDTIAWDDNGATEAGMLPWGQGAGQMVPTRAADPGLVYDLTPLEYDRFLCGQGQSNPYDGEYCRQIGTIAAADLNLASLTVADMLGTQTVTRTVTNVGQATATYRAQAALPGYAVSVTPSVLTLAPGASASYKVKLARAQAGLHTWAYGALVWSDGNGHTVRSPLTVSSATLKIPMYAYSEAASGNKLISIGTDFTGTMSAQKGDLVAATESSFSIDGGGTGSPANNCLKGTHAGFNTSTFTVAPDSLLFKVTVRRADIVSDHPESLNLMVISPSRSDTGIQYGRIDAQGNLSYDLTWPRPGEYTACVYDNGAKDEHAEYKLSTWVLPTLAQNAPGNLKVTLPGVMYAGHSGTVGLSWSGLEQGKHYLGAVAYYRGVDTPTGMSTVLEVDTSDPVPQVQRPRNRNVLAF
jgi:subtilisin family serine protease